MEHVAHDMTDVAVIRRFVLAGDAIITLQSERTERHFTYRVRQADPIGDRAVDRWFISVLQGTETYAYIGMLRSTGSHLRFGVTKKSTVSADAVSFQAFNFFWNNLDGGRMPPSMKIRHEGRCGRCARVLTHPESIDLGLGPDCAEKMGL